MSQLRTALAAYTPWTVPFPGEPGDLTPQQREANFAATMAAKPARIAALREGLPGLEAAFTALLDPAAPLVPAIQMIEAWWIGELSRIDLVPPVTSTLRRLLRPGAYLAANEALALADWHKREDEPLVPALATLLGDLGLVLGEAVVLRRPDFGWALNHDAAEKRRDTQEWGRTCIMRPKLGSFPLQAFAMPWLARSSYGQLIADKRRKMLVPAHEEGGLWHGRFFGWTAVHIIDGRFTNDFYPDGPDGERVPGWRHGQAPQ